MISQSYPQGIKRPRPFSSQEIMRVASKKMQDGSEPIYTGNPHQPLLTPPLDLISVPHTYPSFLLPPSYTPHSVILIICVPCPSHTSLSPVPHPPTYTLPLSYSSYPPPSLTLSLLPHSLLPSSLAPLLPPSLAPSLSPLISPFLLPFSLAPPSFLPSYLLSSPLSRSPCLPLSLSHSPCLPPSLSHSFPPPSLPLSFHFSLLPCSSLTPPSLLPSYLAPPSFPLTSLLSPSLLPHSSLFPSFPPTSLLPLSLLPSSLFL